MENKSKTSNKGTKFAVITVCTLVLLIAVAAVILLFSLRGGRGTPADTTGNTAEPRPADVELPSGETVQVDLNDFYPAESDVLIYDSEAEERFPSPAGYTEVLTGLESTVLDAGSGLTLLSVGSYSGKYIEDGSDVYVSDVMSVTVRNDGDEDIQMASVFVSIDNVFCEFTVTTLPKGAAAVVLEKNKHPYTEDGIIKYAYADDVVYFVEDVSAQSESVRVTAWNGYVNISNISGRDIEGELTVYYKSYEAGKYFGGITYFVRAENGIPSGRSVTLPASHFVTGSSKIMFVIFEDAADGE